MFWVWLIYIGKENKRAFQKSKNTTFKNKTSRINFRQWTVQEQEDVYSNLRHRQRTDVHNEEIKGRKCGINKTKYNTNV